MIRLSSPRAAFARLAAKYGVSVLLLASLAGKMGWYRQSRTDDER